MDLIVKITERCNFKCTFCSSTMIADGRNPQYDLETDKIYKFLDRFPETQTIIINGGDPLMSPPEVYWEMISELEKRGMNDTVISFTTNLWDFYLHPEKWTELFKHPKVSVNTSFNYGDTRRITKTRIFTEDDFVKVINLFEKEIGYKPDFIAVITEENEHNAIDNVRLAKHLGVECKLNYAFASGDQSKPYPIGKMYKIYAQIHKEGLGPWEFNTKQMAIRLKGHATVCPQNRNCDYGIRSLQPDRNGENYYSCGAFGDDGEYAISFEKEMQGQFFTPLQEAEEIHHLKEECLVCPAFEICNGCYKTIRDLKKSDMVEVSCKAMKEAIGYIEEAEEVELHEESRHNSFSQSNVSLQSSM